MPAPAHCLGIAVAPTHLCLVLIDQNGAVVAELDRAHGTAADSEPGDWWRACRTGVKDILRRAEITAEAIRAIGVSGDPSVLVVCDKHGKALAPVTFGNDPRCIPGIEQILTQVGGRNFANLTGQPPGIASPLAKLLHLRATAKRAWHDTARILSAKDWLRLRLTGTATTDGADASATLLFNPKSRAWSKQILQPLDIDLAVLAELAEGDAIAGRVSEIAARETGLQMGTPVVVGASHAAAITIAAGVLKPGTLVVELGRGGAMAALAAEHGRATETLKPGCHALGGHVRTAMAADGIAAAVWVMERLSASESATKRAQRDPIDTAIDQAAEVPVGADGLLFLPAHDLRAATLGDFHDLGPKHHRGHMLRACLESGVLQARIALAETGATDVIAIGPGAAMPFWVQLLADGCDRPVTPIHISQPAAFGAAILAASSVGIHKGVSEAMGKMIKRRAQVAPRRLAAAVHQQQAATLAALRKPAAIVEAAP